MREPVILKICEIFSSAQGEGSRMGEAAIFIRLAGCSLRCSFCDTPHALSGGTSMSVVEVMEQVEKIRRRFPNSQVVITGGEPLEQNLFALVDALNRKGLFLAVETNGIHFQDLAVHWWAISPKPASHFRVDSRLGERAAEFKFVVTPRLECGIVNDLRKKYPRPPIFLQPDALNPEGMERTREMYDMCRVAGIAGIRLGVQMHRVYGID